MATQKEILEIDAKKAIDALKKTQTEAASTTKTMKDLRNELKAIKDSMTNMEEGSEEFLQAANNAGTLKHQIDEISQSVNGASSDFGDMVGNVSKLSAGMVGAFQTAQAAMSLFGIESEEVVKSIKTMQNLMAMTQGLSSIDAGIKSLAKLRNSITGTTVAAKALRAALTPKSILALTAAIGAAVYIFEQFNKKQKEAAVLAKQQANAIVESNTRALDSYKQLVAGLGNENREVTNSLFNVAESQLDTVLRNESNLTQEQTLLVKRLLKQRQDVYKELRENGDKYNQEQLNNLTRQLGVINAGWLRNVENISANVKSALQDYEQAYSNIINFVDKKKTNDNSNANKDDSLKAEYARLEYTKAANKEYGESVYYLKDLLEIQNKELETLKENSVEWFNLKTRIEQTKTAISDFYNVKKPELPEEEEDTSSLEDAIIRLQEQYFTEEQIIAIEEQKKLQIVQNAIDQGVINEKYGEELKTKIAKEASEARKQIIEAELAAKMNASVQFLSSFASMFDSIGRMIGEESEDAFEANKAFQATAIVINTIAGAIGAYMGAVSNTGLNAIPGAGPAIAQALGITNAIAVTATGAAQLAELNRKKFGDKSLEGGSYTASNSAITSTLVAPQLFSATVQNAEIEKNISSSKVYVVESDIKDTGNKVAVQESENRY